MCRDRLIGVRTITASLAVEESCVELPPAIRRFYDVNAMSEEVDGLQEHEPMRLVTRVYTYLTSHFC